MVGTMGQSSHITRSYIPLLFKPSPLKTCAKDDVAKTYWIYPTEEVVDHFEKKHVLKITPFVIFAKNIKQKDFVFALLNREVIEAL